MINLPDCVNVDVLFEKGPTLVKSRTSPHVLQPSLGTIVCFHNDQLCCDPSLLVLEHLSHSVKPPNSNIHLCHVCSTKLWSRSTDNINPGLNMSLFSSSIVYKWRPGSIFSEHIVCVTTKANLNAHWPYSADSQTLDCWLYNVRHSVGKLFWASILCWRSRDSANTPECVCACTVCVHMCVCISQIPVPVLSKQLKAENITCQGAPWVLVPLYFLLKDQR